MRMNDKPEPAKWLNALDRARVHSPFLSGALGRMPDLEALLAEGQIDQALSRAMVAGEGARNTGVSLRRERLALSAALAIGDLAGALPLSRVMTELSSLADRALDRAIAAVIRKRVPDAKPAGMIGLALGKHGACELNYSSDIDPILLYDPQTLPRRTRDEPGEVAQRYAREIVQMLSDVTEEGYVFRVDLRLRPASEVSPLAIPVGAALTHYESSALTWERLAFIRARAAAGDIDGGKDFLHAIRSFVWRRSLDFGAIEEIERLTAQIRKTHEGPLTPAPGYNVKLGRGGIREIEFFAQTHQLIHGGRNPDLRQRGTRSALDALARAGLVAEDDAVLLGESYDQLRTVEHRLQMVHDRQTHTLPEGAALEEVALLGGWQSGKELLDYLVHITGQVAARYDRLIDPDASTGLAVPTGDELVAKLTQLGFRDPAPLATRIRSWSDGHIRALRSSAAIAAFEAVCPALLEALSEASDPDLAIARWETFLTKTSSAINLFRLLEARPGLLEQLLRILTLAGPLADELAYRPQRLDSLIDRSAFDLPGSAAEIAHSMQVDGEEGYENQLDRIRIVTGDRRFALGVQLIEGVHDPLEIGTGLARLAEAGVKLAVDTATREYTRTHGVVEGSEMAVLGLGRFGGGMLTHASDLDMIYLFSGTHERESDGARPLGATLYYNRLAQRISAALSVPTAQGPLYEVDTRLRPQGTQGPLAVSIDSFARYQREDAWTWEHMALSRARVIVGSDSVRKSLQLAIDQALARPRDPADLRRDVMTMRAEMALHKPAQGPLDAKLLRGGLVDLEFLVHFLQLRDAVANTPDLALAITKLADRRLVSDDLPVAYACLTRTLIAGRLLAPDQAVPDSRTASVLAKACGYRDYAEFSQQFDSARQSVADCWRRVFDEKLELE